MNAQKYHEYFYRERRVWSTEYSVKRETFN